jgi:ribose-phosphate pyrophosphokinase
MIFFTPSTEQFRSKISGQHGSCTFTTFQDGEMLVELHEEVAGKEVWVITATNPPAENLIELFFLLDALQRAGAIINLFFTYFGYARQDRARTGQSLGAQVIGNFLTTFSYTAAKILQVHNPAIQTFFPFEDIIPLQFFADVANGSEVVVAPDKGCFELAHAIAHRIDAQCAHIEKERYAPDKTKVIGLQGDVKGKKIFLVDDMISTGGTIVHAARALKEQGAGEVHVAATHGIFAGDAIKRINESAIDYVWVTNSLPQDHGCEKIKVYDIATLINKSIP